MSQAAGNPTSAGDACEVVIPNPEPVIVMVVFVPADAMGGETDAITGPSGSVRTTLTWGAGDGGGIAPPPAISCPFRSSATSEPLVAAPRGRRSGRQGREDMVSSAVQVSPGSP
jgi:hypothetical protein